MPRSRPSGVTANGHTTIRSPGAYLHVLQKMCRERTHDCEYALTDCTAEEAAQCERENERRAAALMAERMGEPLNAQSYMLPDGLPAPFERFPVGRQRCFRVEPDDTITLRSSGRFQ
jgi:hypothetical protein